jgi:acyl-CoA thioesterase
VEHVKTYFEQDKFAKHAGIKILAVGDGYAKTEMPVQQFHKNATGSIHGGALFTLADFTQAVAANSRGQVSVAVNVSITYLKAVSDGTLTAEAHEVSDGKKLASYRIDIKDTAGDIISVAQGMVYRKHLSIQGFDLRE